MAAYIVAHVNVTDPETYDRYRARVPATVEAYGGRFLIRGADPEELEGTWDVPRLVVLEFPDKAAARRFYDSPEYQEIIGLRLQASEGRLAIFEGAPGT
jgi:uncharacterized protein (DUF1330 family)